MIKLGLKNYLKSYRYFFVPIGALALGIVVGFSVMVPLVWGAIKTFVSGVADVMGNISVHWDAVKDALVDAFNKLDWMDPQQTASHVFTAEYLGELLRDCAAAALGDTSAAQDEMVSLTEKAVSTMSGAVAWGVFFAFVGALIGYVFTRAMIRSGMAERPLPKIILSIAIDAVIKVTIIAGGAILIARTQKYAVLSWALVILVYGVAEFLQAFFVHGFKKVPFKKVISIKNILLLALLSAIEIAIMFGVTFLLNKFTTPAIALVMGFSIFVITVSCLQLNAEAYVKSLADNPEVEQVNKEHLAVAYHGLAPIALADRRKLKRKEEVEVPTQEPPAQVDTKTE